MLLSVCICVEPSLLLLSPSSPASKLLRSSLKEIHLTTVWICACGPWLTGNDGANRRGFRALLSTRMPHGVSILSCFGLLASSALHRHTVDYVQTTLMFQLYAEDICVFSQISDARCVGGPGRVV